MRSRRALSPEIDHAAPADALAARDHLAAQDIAGVDEGVVRPGAGGVGGDALRGGSRGPTRRAGSRGVSQPRRAGGLRRRERSARGKRGSRGLPRDLWRRHSPEAALAAVPHPMIARNGSEHAAPGVLVICVIADPRRHGGADERRDAKAREMAKAMSCWKSAGAFDATFGDGRRFTRPLVIIRCIPSAFPILPRLSRLR